MHHHPSQRLPGQSFLRTNILRRRRKFDFCSAGMHQPPASQRTDFEQAFRLLLDHSPTSTAGKVVARQSFQSSLSPDPRDFGLRLIRRHHNLTNTLGRLAQVIIEQMRVAMRGLRLSVTEQSSDRMQTDAGAGEDRSVRMAQVVDP